MILAVLAGVALALAGLYAVVTLNNLIAYGPPPRPGPGTPSVSILIPARDEAANIGPLLDSVLATQGADIEVVVLDDGSSDGTGALVRGRAGADPRVRLLEGAPLPPGWIGKQHACWALAAAARRPLLLFVDADVRLHPDAVARLAAFMDRRRLGLASGFPRLLTRTLGEQLVIPQIMVLLLGYLPIPMARASSNPGFAAACGQIVAVRREAYDAAGGHAAMRASMHDGLKLARAVRASGGRTDICDLTALASCRMYDNWPDVWRGFVKNAREGMATPFGLPVWTVLLGGGHVLPFALLPVAALADNGAALALASLAALLVWTARGGVAIKARQTPLSVLLHPVGVILVLAIQWTALGRSLLGRPAVWRGRAYDV